MCIKIQNEIERQQFNIDYDYFPSIMNTGISVDEDALHIFPRDISQKELLELYPVRIGADGNCLPYTGRVLTFSDQKRAEEIRVRIIIEQTIFKDDYLDQDYLKRGTDISYTNNALLKTYAMYSDEYVPNERLNFTKSGNSLPKRMYPMLGNPNVRKDLHRLILPRQTIAHETSYVMWTTTRTDMNETNWVPNHFVAALKLENRISENTREQEYVADEAVSNAHLTEVHDKNVKTGVESQNVLDIEMEEKKRLPLRILIQMMQRPNT
ncbi:unnamed protein product [Mytilus coruscus]|uniref:Uncharacterized protein n=1 Tax=Mytilus coruscus TaxID=42192 RepID=A0A6J8DUJ4_MYTCO|nr:unnamed protein product [Mytilus coruscus]